MCEWDKINSACYAIAWSANNLPPGLNLSATSVGISGILTESGIFMSKIFCTTNCWTVVKNVLFTVTEGE